MPQPLSFDELQTLAENIVVGFQALQDRIEEQKRIESKLRLQLAHSVEKYEKFDKSCNSSSGEISDWRDEIVKQIEPTPPSIEFSSCVDSEKSIEKAQEALKALTATRMLSPTKIKSCPVTLKVPDQEDFEHDFTTPGRVGDLGCPFATMKDGRDGDCGPDPIAEEFHGEKVSSRSKSSGQNESRCPIRFLDKHSPEEIAQYFEKHKHEIPRSHEICVKRYQQNEESIRQLDAQYGNLVSMIQGLGNKHKQYLHENEKAAVETERDSTKAVEEWAEEVSQRSVLAVESERLPHFERPLRDIRVGESPSRPWGISVPAGKSPAASASPSENHDQPTGKIASNGPAPAPQQMSRNQKSRSQNEEHITASSRPQIVFNGPVFFGYTAEQTASFLQKLSGEPSTR